ncbi:MAG: DUF5011 domain-containing protein [Firmicutes bacterium]|nr:DUF5011 domain-containing protein [Bacillota bacterium]
MRHKKLLFTALAFALTLCTATGVAACGNDKPDNNDPKPGEQTFTKPKITIASGMETLEITQGTPEDEINLLVGITVADDYDSDLKATISDDGGFDANTVGTYTVKYKATNSKGETTEITRTVKVVKAPSALVLKAEKAIDSNWTDGAIMKFSHDLFYTLTADATYEDYKNGVFYNASESSVVLSIAGGGGEAAILTKNGMVIEGRDGANGALMNIDHPQRVDSTARSFVYDDVEYSVANDTYKFMTIPAGGFAVVVTTGMMGQGFDYDGRSFINKNVIYQYGTSVQLYWEDEPETILTPYVDKAPIVRNCPALTVALGTTEADMRALAVSGISVSDDNGTFDVSDDITNLQINIENIGGYNGDQSGEYIVDMNVSDANGNITRFSRKVIVADNVTNVSIGSAKTGIENIVIKQNVSVADYTKVDFAIYTKEFTGTLADSAYGQAFVVDDASSKIVRIYDGANAKYYDAENTSGVAGSSLETPLTQQNFIALAFASLGDGETLVIAPRYGMHNNATYTLLLGNRKINETFSVDGYTFGLKTVTAGTAKAQFKVLKNTTWSNAPGVVMVYTKAYQGEIKANGYGIAVVLDAEGKLIKTYDAVSGAYMDEAHSALTNPMDNTITDGHRIKFALMEGGLTAANYVTYAFTHLAEGETLVAFPHDGNNAADSARTFANGNLRAGFGTKVVSFGMVAINENNVTVGNDSATLAVNVNAAWTNAAGYVNVYSKNYTGTVKGNGYGYAFVVNAATGKITKIYDAANGYYMDETHSALSGDANVRQKFADYNTEKNFTGEDAVSSANYAAHAFANLAEGEILVAFPNVNKGEADTARTFANKHRTIGAKIAFFGIDLASL